MTKLTKPIKRTTDILSRDRGKLRAICVELDPAGLVRFRYAGTRKVWETSIVACMQLAQLQEADRLRAERKAKRKRGKS